MMKRGQVQASQDEEKKNNKGITSNMQGSGSTPYRPASNWGPATNFGDNPELWVQLGEETRSTNLAILEIVQELKNEMAWLREDNARLTMEQERILKSLSDKQNPPLANPSAEQQKMTEEERYHAESEIPEEGEDQSDNASEQQTSKRQKVELQG